APAPAESNATARGPLNVSAPAPTSQTTDAATDDSFDFDDEADQAGDDTDELGDEAMPPASAQSSRSDPRSFADVVAVVGEKRDAKLKIHLEDNVSLVKFDAVAGSIDIFLLPGAPPELANDLREKLNAWTGRRWMVVLSKEAGQRA